MRLIEQAEVQNLGAVFVVSGQSEIFDRQMGTQVIMQRGRVRNQSELYMSDIKECWNARNKEHGIWQGI